MLDRVAREEGLAPEGGMEPAIAVHSRSRDGVSAEIADLEQSHGS